MLTLSTKAALTLFGEQIIAELRQNFIRRGVNASGETSESAEMRVTDNGLQILAAGHIFALETGRKPGKQPPREAIRKWIDDKGITPEGISKDSLAFLIARKIGREGTLIHRQGGKSGVLTEILNRQNLTDGLTQDLANFYATEITSQVLETFKV